MVKSVSSCCVRGRWVLSNPVTNDETILVCVWLLRYIHLIIIVATLGSLNKMIGESISVIIIT